MPPEDVERQAALTILRHRVALRVQVSQTTPVRANLIESPMIDINNNIRTDANVATAVALVPVPLGPMPWVIHGVMHIGIFTADPKADPKPDRG
jgi:hypothetical protein